MTRDVCNRIPKDLLRALLENPHESQIVVDAEGIIRFVSVHTEEFYEVPPEEMIGKHILEMNPESRLPQVLATGKAEIGSVLRMGGKERIVARIPIKNEKGEIVGAVGKLMFWHLTQLKELVRQVEVLENRLDYYEKELKQVYSNRYALDQVVGQSPAMREAKQVAAQAAESDLTVLITGETGTGKEVFAHAIHQMSAREGKPFVKVNCAAIPQELFESELFGYEAGAFTGASSKGKPGKFELADGGTIFLDEVGDLPLALQVKLLRVIQEQEVERLGGTRTLQLDFRVIAATNRDLKEMMQKHAYRQDLYYRLNIFRLRTPALREITEDIPRIAYHILSGLHQDGRSQVNRISPEAMERMACYAWPGNVRELRNVIERAAAVARGGAISQEHLPVDLLEGASGTTARPQLQPLPLREEMALAERRVIEKALRFTGGNRTQAARLLGIHRTGLHQKLRAYDLS